MQIELRGVRVHNLKGIDLDLPYNNLIVFCGPSGSGKSSLAMDTLYAEGQRRYIESFSSYTRQFLEKLEKPDAQRIDGIPPAIAVTARQQGQISRSTVGTATETIEYLRLLFAKIGRIACRECGCEVRVDSPESIWSALTGLLTPEQPELRVLIGFVPPVETLEMEYGEFRAHWLKLGFIRGLRHGVPFRLDEAGLSNEVKEVYDTLRKNAGLNGMGLNSMGLNSEESGTATTSGSANATGQADCVQVDYAQGDFEGMEAEVFGDILPEEQPGYVPPLAEDLPPVSSSDAVEDDFDDDPEAETKATSGFFLGEDGPELPKTGGNVLLHGNPTDDPAKGVASTAGSNAGPVRKSPPEAKDIPLVFLVDKLTIGKTEPGRIRDSLETALVNGGGKCVVLYPDETGDVPPFRLTFSDRLACEDCGIEYPALEPRLFSFNSPLGACPTCEGFGNLVMFDLDLIIPHKGRSLKEGAIAPWNSPSYRQKLDELLRIAPGLGIPIDVPFSKLTADQRTLLLYGNENAVATKKRDPRGKGRETSKEINHEKNRADEPVDSRATPYATPHATPYEIPPAWPGLIAFFEKLQKQKYKMHIRVFLSRWRSYRPCPDCHGSRLRPESLAVRIDGKNIADLSSMKVEDLLDFLRNLELSDWQKSVSRTALEQAISRLAFLREVGLGYLTLDRTMRTLSGGEQRRVGLTSALGSSLVDMLYVLDEPSIGLHPGDTAALLGSIGKLRDRGNTVIVVEHEERFLRAADRIVEIGPEAGQGGGHVVFNGNLAEMLTNEQSLTGSYLSGKRGSGKPSKRRPADHGVLELFGASGRNLRHLDIAFPMGVLCLITGPSGAGKSSLIQETLYPALCRKLGKENGPRGLPCDKILGTGQIDDVVMVDQSPIGRSPRSNPITYLKIFDEIRGVFADTVEAKTKNYTAGYFSFNVDGGRCNTCKGDGFIAIDMQFMADMFIRCPQCRGTRYQSEILEITYRGKTIADVLEMTAREAFGFFRGRTKVQQRLKRLIDVGLDYVRLGQPANTLSGGESQRLKLAAYLSNVKRGRCLFLLDEPTTGLHFADIVQLLDCFDALLRTGHSLIVVEHNLQLMKAADYIIDLGPGAAERGGRVVARGTPEELARNPESATGRFLAEILDGETG